MDEWHRKLDCASLLSLSRLSATSFRLSEPTSLRAQMLVSSPGTGNLGFIGNVLYYIELAGGTSSVAIPDSVLSLLPLRPNSLAIALKFLS